MENTKFYKELDASLRNRYWNLYREAIEAFTKAIEDNQNGTLIHSLERVVRIRERDLDRVEGK